ncbi:hypothetical protein MBAV_000456 [Candidatus Magnetobacterium bavaricum]|uniref:Uncharacterized protein n=1 Tax=Candidatus Magnetobacterium bavaricum TaxID=29290 RepID=A0A0F3GZG3_9BACT|nr:hypothetical protein MBAV_000456 [Candidatus Magnetobacterium bavaricum]
MLIIRVRPFDRSVLFKRPSNISASASSSITLLCTKLVNNVTTVFPIRFSKSEMIPFRVA